MTNRLADEELVILDRLCRLMFHADEFSIRQHIDLAHPFNLTWCHKTIIAEEFVPGDGRGYTHFVYLEDDLHFSFGNFCYFLNYRSKMEPAGLVPSFVRVEYNAINLVFVNTDNPHPFSLAYTPNYDIGQAVVVNQPQPYCGCFVLDVALAREYIESKSFDLKASAELCHWGIRERAAMGLCFERVPQSYKYRYAIPIEKQTHSAPPWAWVWHMPNTYADDPNKPFGKVAMDSLVLGPIQAPSS